jgi:hypothetical protein
MPDILDVVLRYKTLSSILLDSFTRARYMRVSAVVHPMHSEHIAYATCALHEDTNQYFYNVQRDTMSGKTGSAPDRVG